MSAAPVTAETVVARIRAALPEARVEIVPNGSACGTCSVAVDRGDALAVARFLKSDAELRLDYASNVTGIDYLPRTVKEKRVRMEVVEGEAKEVAESVERQVPGYLEAVYHLYSVERKHGPVVVRVRTPGREADVSVPSLTPVWKGAEYQEREIYDLYGIRFEGHPDLRRLLMWDEFEGHPMRKDYVAPDDSEYEPTPHGELQERAARHYPGREGAA